MKTLLEREYRKLVTDPLDAISQQTGDSPYQVFSDWIDLALASFTGDEDAYQKPLTRYAIDGRNEDTVRELATQLANALGGLVLAMEQTNEDVLGGVYEHYGLTSSHFAQYFTPGAVSRAMAAMNLPDGDDLRDATAEDPLVIGDISGCGSGRLIVDTANHLREIAPEAPAVFLGYDKDPICAKIAVLNFVLNDLTGYVLLGDSLKLEAHRVWFVSVAQLARGDHPVKALDADGRDRVLARFFGVPLGDGATEPSMDDEADVESGHEDDERVTEPPMAHATSVESALDVALDGENTAQVGFDEFA
jgi:hypothetical protein